MNVITRGVRNAFRNNVRTGSIVLILSLSIALALAMYVARAAVEDKIDAVKSSVGNTLSVSPAGIRGNDGGGELLKQDVVDSLKEVAHVSAVSYSLNDRLTTETSSLISAIDPGTFGNRRARDSGVGTATPPPADGAAEAAQGQGQPRRSFTPPIAVIGLKNLAAAKDLGAGTLTFISGQAYPEDSSELVAVVGKTLAEKNTLSIGSTFKMYGKDMKVVGIFDTGNAFANAGVISVPLKTLQELSTQQNLVSSATVTINSIDNVKDTNAAVAAKLGASADVVSNLDTAITAVEPLENIKKISLYSMFGAVIAGSVIILLTMVMIVRERRREIGVLKAIGASNGKVVGQFMTEAVTLTVIAAIVGIALGILVAAPITKALVSSSTNTATNTSSNQQGGQRQNGPPGGGRGGFGRLSSRGLDIANVKTSIGWDVLGYGVFASVLIAILGSALPAWLITKVRPAEVMRTE
jgi:putative ABC transport system permease protein